MQINAARCAQNPIRRIAGLGGVFHMLDVLMLAIGLGFFALSIGYAYACDRL
jgi:hypothetical protein